MNLSSPFGEGSSSCQKGMDASSLLCLGGMHVSLHSLVY